MNKIIGLADYEGYVMGERHVPLRRKPLTEYELEVLMLSNAIAGEAGEVANKIKKALREGYRPGSGLTRTVRSDLAFELGDTLHYLVRLINTMGYTTQQIMEMNKFKLDARDHETTQTGETPSA